MTRLELVKEGMNSTHYSVYEDEIYVGESFAYAEDLKSTFEINITWIFFSKLKEDFKTFIQNNEYKLLNDIEDGLNIGFNEYRKWNYNTRVILKGEIINLENLATNY